MSLNLDAARRIYRVLVYLVHNHEVVDPRELKVLEDFAIENGIAPPEIQSMHEERSQTDRLTLSKSEEERSKLMDMMIEVVAADGCIETSEQNRLARVADLLGLDQGLLKSKLMDRLIG